LIAVSSLGSSKNKGLVEHFLEPAMYLCKDVYAILGSNKDRVINKISDKSQEWNYGIFKRGENIRLSFQSVPFYHMLVEYLIGGCNLFPQICQ
jgi:hypothetical protein